MNREIKFRVWDNVDYLSTPFTLRDVDTHKIQFTDDCIVMQYTGLKDKNGKEIYEGDIVLFPDEEREFVDVGIGVPLQVAAQPVKELGQVTFENGGFGFNCNRKSAYYEKGFSSFTLADFKPELNELEDIEIIGNIYENPELLTNN